jgi:glycylpeptide N-tetradecanoyltransferase
MEDAIIDTTAIESDHDDASGAEQAEESTVPSNEGPSTSSGSGKKKKKKKSKAAKFLNKLKGNDDEEIPQEVVDTVMEEIRAQGTLSPEELTAENIRHALQQMKMLDVVQGKAGVGGINAKDMGEHKV